MAGFTQVGGRGAKAGPHQRLVQVHRNDAALSGQRRDLRAGGVAAGAHHGDVLAIAGITTVHGAPNSADAYPMDWAWLPVE